MARKVQIGQIWKFTQTGDNYLVTKVYAEGLGTYAVLRKTGAEQEGTVRVKVDRSESGQVLPGYTYAQESEEF